LLDLARSNDFATLAVESVGECDTRTSAHAQQEKSHCYSSHVAQ